MLDESHRQHALGLGGGRKGRKEEMGEYKEGK